MILQNNFCTDGHLDTALTDNLDDYSITRLSKYIIVSRLGQFKDVHRFKGGREDGSGRERGGEAEREREREREEEEGRGTTEDGRGRGRGKWGGEGRGEGRGERGGGLGKREREREKGEKEGKEGEGERKGREERYAPKDSGNFRWSFQPSKIGSSHSVYTCISMSHS